MGRLVVVVQDPSSPGDDGADNERAINIALSRDLDILAFVGYSPLFSTDYRRGSYSNWSHSHWLPDSLNLALSSECGTTNPRKLNFASVSVHRWEIMARSLRISFTCPYYRQTSCEWFLCWCLIWQITHEYLVATFSSVREVRGSLSTDPRLSSKRFAHSNTCVFDI